MGDAQAGTTLRMREDFIIQPDGPPDCRSEYPFHETLNRHAQFQPSEA